MNGYFNEEVSAGIAGTGAPSGRTRQGGHGCTQRRIQNSGGATCRHHMSNHFYLGFTKVVYGIITLFACLSVFAWERDRHPYINEILLLDDTKVV